MTTPENDFDKRLGANIRYARIAARLSQTTLGERLGVSCQQVQKYENGKNRVSAHSLVMIAEVVGKPVTDLLALGDVPVATSVSDMREHVKVGTLLDRIASPRIRRRVVALVDALSEGGSDDASERQAA